MVRLVLVSESDGVVVVQTGYQLVSENDGAVVDW